MGRHHAPDAKRLTQSSPFRADAPPVAIQGLPHHLPPAARGWSAAFCVSGRISGRTLSPCGSIWDVLADANFFEKALVRRVKRRFAMRIVRLARSMCEVLTCAGSGLSAPCVSHWKDDGLASSEPQISVVRRRLRRHEFPPAVPSRDTEPTEDECGPAPVEPVQGRPQTLRLPNVGDLYTSVTH